MTTTSLPRRCLEAAGGREPGDDPDCDRGPLPSVDGWFYIGTPTPRPLPLKALQLGRRAAS